MPSVGCSSSTSNADDRLDEPAVLDEPDPEEVADHDAPLFWALKAKWDDAPDLRAAWAAAPATVRTRFVVEVLRSDGVGAN